MTRRVVVPNKLLYKPVEVTWLDHVGHGPQWVDVKQIDHNPATFTTVGYLLAIHPATLTLGSTLDDARLETGDVTVLVRSCVTRIRPLVRS